MKKRSLATRRGIGLIHFVFNAATWNESDQATNTEMRSAQMLKECPLEEAASEIGYGLNNLPDWVIVFVRGITHILAVK